MKRSVQDRNELLAFIVFCSAFLFLGYDSLRFLKIGIEAIQYPFEIDYGEGPLLNQVRQLLAGRGIYASYHTEPYLVSTYPPVFHFVTILVNGLTPTILAAGRSVSVVSTVCIALMIGISVWQLSHPQSEKKTRFFAATLSSFIFLSFAYCVNWGVLMRVDMLANLFAFAGFLSFVRWGSSAKKLYIPAVFFLLAVYTKQSTVAAAAACFTVACLKRRDIALRLVLWLVFGGGLLFLAASVLSSGEFYKHIIFANVNDYQLASALSYVSDFFARCPFYILVALWMLYASLRSIWIDTGQEPFYRWRGLLYGVYFIWAFLVSLTIGKIGANVNYFLEVMQLVCIFFGIGLTSLPKTKWMAMVFPVLLLVQVFHRPFLFYPRTPWDSFRQIFAEEAVSKVLERVKQADGPVLSEDLVLLSLADKTVGFQPFIMTQLAKKARWDQQALLDKITGQGFALIVLKFDAESPNDLGMKRFTPEMIKTIARHYSATERVGQYVLYEPP